MVKIDGWCPTRKYEGKVRLLSTTILKAFDKFADGKATAIELLQPMSHLTSHYKNRDNLTFHSGDIERRLDEMSEQGYVKSTGNKTHPYGWGTIYEVVRKMDK